MKKLFGVVIPSIRVHAFRRPAPGRPGRGAGPYVVIPSIRVHAFRLLALFV